MCDNFCGWLSPKESTLKTTIGIHDDILQIDCQEIVETFLVYIDIRTVEFDHKSIRENIFQTIHQKEIYKKKDVSEKMFKKELAVFLEGRLYRLAEVFLVEAFSRSQGDFRFF